VLPASSSAVSSRIDNGQAAPATLLSSTLHGVIPVLFNSFLGAVSGSEAGTRSVDAKRGAVGFDASSSGASSNTVTLRNGVIRVSYGAFGGTHRVTIVPVAFTARLTSLERPG